MNIISILCFGAVLCSAIAMPQQDSTADVSSIQALILAILKGDVAQVESLIKNDAGLINSKAINGETPLHEAVKRGIGFVEIADTLIKHGSNVNAIDDYKNTPLHFIGRIDDDDKQYAMAELLVNNFADTDAKNTDNRAPFELTRCQKITLQKKIPTN